MRYLGGKSRYGKEIAECVAPRGLWWEPFCGGLNVTPHLAKFGPGLASDVHPTLIALYEAVRAGWNPPESVSEGVYAFARTLPDDSPLKGFAGFGCSFGGKWFGGYARGENRNWAAECLRGLRKTLPLLTDVAIAHSSFFDVVPRPSAFDVIYADPPYAGTTAYTVAFDSAAFWQRCIEWAHAGSRVFVSEYSCPIAADVVWAREHVKTVGLQSHLAPSVEKLFRVLP